jgi:hypothetical protein
VAKSTRAWPGWLGVLLGVAVAGAGVGLAAQDAIAVSAAPTALSITAGGGGGMAPSIVAGDQVSAAAVGDGVRRGDIALVEDPGSTVSVRIGRVIALGGDKLAVTGTVLLVDGHRINEDYLGSPGRSGPGDTTLPIGDVPAGAALLASDDRSGDSVGFLILPTSKISGVVQSVRRGGQQVLRPTSAFTDAGLAGAPHPVVDATTARERLPYDVLGIIVGWALLALSSLFVRIRRGRARKAAAAPPVTPALIGIGA